MVTLSRTISRALRRLQILISSFDWFIRLSASFVIGLTDYFGFDLRRSIENHSILWESNFKFGAIKAQPKLKPK